MTTGRRIAVVASELLGRRGTGGAGTADSLLAIALGRHGHRVQILVATGRDIGDLDPAWTEAYASAGVDIRFLERSEEVTPDFMRASFEVFEALRAEPPEVVIVNDWRGLGYVAQGARHVGLALTETAFVVHCHGPARVLAAFADKVPDTLARFGEEVTERASLVLADAVVSPSEWLLGWMREHDWSVPQSAKVIQYVRQSVAVGQEVPPPPEPSRVTRLAFFGQLREGKGLRIYLEALNDLGPALLAGCELLFLGRETRRWNADAIERALRPPILEAVADLRVEPGLERAEAFDELRRPGTLALMPSLLDNSPNTVAECIENGIPFLSTTTGGIPELVANADRSRVLCAPTARDLVVALRAALEAPEGVAAARPARDPADSLQAWLELVAAVTPPGRAATPARVAVDIVVTDEDSAERARMLATRSILAQARVLQSGSRKAGLDDASADWVLFLDKGDVPDEDLLDRMVEAQHATAADVVTCAVRYGGVSPSVRLFLGDPGSLGLTENQYGVVGLVRRSHVASHWQLDDAADRDWVLFARLVLAGARIVSIPEPLAVLQGRPGTIGDVPGDGLAVLEAFEERRLDGLPDLPQLAATLAATLDRVPREGSRDRDPGGISQRGLRLLREEGAVAVLKRVGRRVLPRRGAS